MSRSMDINGISLQTVYKILLRPHQNSSLLLPAHHSNGIRLPSSVFHTALTITNRDQVQKFRATLPLELKKFQNAVYQNKSHLYL